MRLEHRYSRLDRFLHRLAFSTIGIQKGLADIEDRIYARRFADVEIDRPVFITSLPRAGTTLLLQLISSLDNFVAHTYRDMPFLMIPLLWHAISHRFHAPNAVFQRGHGDGMTIGYDSVEAFEEILWHAFWKDKYLEDRILIWQADDLDEDDEFQAFMTRHIRKLISLRAIDEPHRVRYVSKNNANVSRIPKIVRLFPDAVILIPFRNPVDHVGSMLAQHRNFHKIQAEDKFARRYIEDVGHFEFGASNRPINFDDWLDKKVVKSKDTADFWLEYWCAAYHHVLAHTNDNIVFVDYDVMCANPLITLQNLGQRIGLDEVQALTEKASGIRAPVGYDSDELAMEQSLHDQALTIHDFLRDRASSQG